MAVAVAVVTCINLTGFLGDMIAPWMLIGAEANVGKGCRRKVHVAKRQDKGKSLKEASLV